MAFYAKCESPDEGRRKNTFSSPSSHASGKMPCSPRLAHKAPVTETKIVFIVFNYNFSAFLLQKFSV